MPIERSVWPGFPNPNGIRARYHEHLAQTNADRVDEPPLSRRRLPEPPHPEPPLPRRRALPDSVDPPPVTRHAPLVEPPPVEPPRRVRRALPDSVDPAPPSRRTRHEPAELEPRIRQRPTLLEQADDPPFAPRRLTFDEPLPDALPRRLVLPPESVEPPVPPIPPAPPRPRRRRPAGSGGGGGRRRCSPPIDIDDCFEDELDLDDLDDLDPEDEYLDERANAFWRRRRTQRQRAASHAFAELRRRLTERDRHQSALIGALSERLDRETARAKVLWLTLAAGIASALVTKKPIPTALAVIAAASLGRVLFQPAPLRVYLWVTAPRVTTRGHEPSRVLSEPAVLTEAEAEHVSRELGPGAIRLEFNGKAWVHAPRPT